MISTSCLISLILALDDSLLPLAENYKKDLKELYKVHIDDFDKLLIDLATLCTTKQKP